MVEVVVVVTTTTTRRTTVGLLPLGVTFPARGKESGPRGYEARGESGCCRNGGGDGRIAQVLRDVVGSPGCSP